MQNVHNLVLRFRDFLNASMPIAADVFRGDTNDLRADWLQANWEILVEAKIAKYIWHYGDGADCNDRSSRVYLPDIAPTHRVMCKDLANGKIYDFREFVQWNGSSCSYEAPLSHILCSYEPFRVIENVNSQFVLVAL